MNHLVYLVSCSQALRYWMATPSSHLLVCYLELAARGHITKFYYLLSVYKFLGPNLPQD